MKKQVQLLLLILICVFTYSGIFAQNMLTVTKSNEGQTINLPTDQVLEIHLPRVSSNGYIWVEKSSTDKSLAPKCIAPIGTDEFVHDATVTNTSGKHMLGQSGQQIIRYSGSTQGTTVLTFELRRPLEPNSIILDTYTVTINSNGTYTGSYKPLLKSNPVHSTSTPAGIPTKVDWRSKCTPVANQQQCGDCWAYAGVGVLECNILIHDGITRDISEAYLTNCASDAQQDWQGCNGGICPNSYWMAPKGAVYEADCPWTTSLGSGTVGTCGSYTYHETIDSYADVAGENSAGTPPDSAIKRAIYNYGPVWAALDASGSAFQTYTKGIYTETSPAGQTDHAIVLVGYCDSAACPGGGYWILRNSWDVTWGVKGYMYISYGSDLVGTYADYIVYKGGIPHAVPPVAQFSATDTVSCTGTIQFSDLSANTPTSWSWNFGDGTTSTIQNPSHTYTANGKYTVSLKSTNAYGNNTATKTSYITINEPLSPVTTGATIYSATTASLSATGTGTLNWYDASSNGKLVNTGTTFTTPVLSKTTTYYVQSAANSPAKSIGMAAKTATGANYSTATRQGLKFDALTSLTINAVTVTASTTANRTIFVKNSAGVEIDSLTVNIATGTQTVTLNFKVPAGTGYTLGCSSSSNLWREKSGAVYPYTIPGVMSITGSTSTSSGYYYYFYNIQVSSPSCLSSMVSVTATVNANATTGIEESSETLVNVFPNPNNGQFTVAINNPNNEKFNLLIDNVVGKSVYSESVTEKCTKDLSLPKGIYFLRLVGTEKTITKKLIVY